MQRNNKVFALIYAAWCSAFWLCASFFGRKMWPYKYTTSEWIYILTALEYVGFYWLYVAFFLYSSDHEKESLAFPIKFGAHAHL